MKYIGNYKDWIDPNWVKEILSSTGTGRPGEGKKPDSLEELKEYKKAIVAGYRPDAVYFYMFDKNNVSFNLEFPFLSGLKYHWWITKMLPGNFMPMHVDPHSLIQKNSRRFWMPWQDYVGGHIFAYEDTVTTNYSMGDLYEYSNPNAIHGAANVGLVPRIVLQISTYE